MKDWVLLCGVVAGSASIARSVPQILRLVRKGTAAGVSTATWSLGLVCSLLWFSWAIVNHDPVNLVVNTLGTVGAAVVLIRLARDSRRLVCSWLLKALGFAVVALVGEVFWSGSLSVCAVALSCTMFLPQARAAVRDPDLGGVSPSTWALACLSALAWVAYGLGRHSLAVVAPNVVVLPTALFVMGCKFDRSGRVASAGQSLMASLSRA